jgi:hypothetical protein
MKRRKLKNTECRFSLTRQFRALDKLALMQKQSPVHTGRPAAEA